MLLINWQESVSNVGVNLTKTFSIYFQKIESNLKTDWKQVSDGNKCQHVCNKLKMFSVSIYWQQINRNFLDMFSENWKLFGNRLKTRKWCLQIDNILATICQHVDNKVKIFSIYYWQQIENNAETDWKRASDSNKLATCRQQIVNMLATNCQHGNKLLLCWQ